MQQDHVKKKESAAGRWLPLSFYSVNFVLWLATAIIAGAWNLLWLAILPLPALVMYVVRTGKRA